MEFSRQEYWSKLPFSILGDLPDPETELTSLVSPALASRFFATVTPEKPQLMVYRSIERGKKDRLKTVSPKIKETDPGDLSLKHQGGKFSKDYWEAHQDSLKITPSHPDPASEHTTLCSGIHWVLENIMSRMQPGGPSPPYLGPQRDTDTHLR